MDVSEDDFAAYNELEREVLEEATAGAKDARRREEEDELYQQNIQSNETYNPSKIYSGSDEEED